MIFRIGGGWVHYNKHFQHERLPEVLAVAVVFWLPRSMRLPLTQQLEYRAVTASESSAE